MAQDEQRDREDPDEWTSRDDWDRDPGTGYGENLSEEELAAAEARRIGGPAPASEGDGPEDPEADEDPSMRAVREAGGGEAEGFEEAERELIENAAHGDLGHSPRNDAFDPEEESDLSDAEYGGADEIEVSEREDAEEERQ